MLAKTTLSSTTCKPVFNLGSGPPNLVSWSPHVRSFAALGLSQPLWSTLCLQKMLSAPPASLCRTCTCIILHIYLQGRFLALAGFGNLPGDIVFFDRKPDGRCKQMGAVR